MPVRPASWLFPGMRPLLALWPFVGLRAGRWPRLCAAVRCVGGCDRHFRSLAQAVRAVDDDPVTWRKTGFDGKHGSVLRAKLDGTHRYLIVWTNDVDVRSWRAPLDRARRHGYHCVQRLDQKPRINKLVREELVIEVVEIRAQFHRACRRIDLAVERYDLASGQRCDICPVVNGYF